jgi:NAD-dependent deacetylase
MTDLPQPPRQVPDPRELDLLRDWIHRATHTVVFTGAGISTESGIPDFRSPNGFWAHHRPIPFADFLSSEEARRESWRRKLHSHREFRDALPNRGHRAVAELVRRGLCTSVITQNVDGLHQRSGIPEAKVIELHGNGTYASCLDCGQRYPLEPILSAFEQHETLPHCDTCGGVVKTATTSFGQAMPHHAMERAREQTLACDLFIVLGSSLVVLPAAGFPILAKSNGARVAIVNKSPTDFDAQADLTIAHSIGHVMGWVADIA